MNTRIRIFAWAAVLLVTTALTGISAAQSFPPAWSSASSYAVGDQAQLNGNVIRCVHATPASSFKYSYWELWEVRANTNVMVGTGQTFTSLTTAWNYVKSARVSDGVFLHIEISTAKGVFDQTFSSPFSLDQGSGALISLSGDNKSDINLTFNASNGFVVDSGHALGMISEITMTGQSAYTGISATSGGAIGDLANVNVNEFGIGVYAFQSGSIHVENTVNEVTSGTMFAAGLSGNIVIANGISLNGNATGVGTCLYANHNGTIIAEGAIIGASSGFAQGVWAENGAMIDVNFARINACTIGCEADYGGRITLRSSVLGRNGPTNNTDIKVFTAGTADATSSTNNESFSLGSNDGSFIYT